jgi:hypothetical protein
MLHTIMFFMFSLPADKVPAPRIKVETSQKEAAPKRFDFDDDVVIGDLAGPLFDSVTQRPKVKFGSLIPVREDFNQEIMKSVYDL